MSAAQERFTGGVYRALTVQSCREHGINPLFYLADALREISSIPASEVATLTPTGWRRRLRQAAEAKRSQIAIESVVRDLTFGR